MSLLFLARKRVPISGFFGWRLPAAVVGALALSVATAATEGQLTLADAQRVAIERSRQLAAQDSAVTASREMAAAAGQLPDPTLRLGVSNVPTEGPDRFSTTRDFMTMRSIGLMQEFTRSEKRELRAERFTREADKALAEKVATTTTIMRDTALAWLDRYYVEAMAAVLAEEMDEAKREIVAAEGAYRAGRGSQADVFAAHSAVVALEDRASEFNRRIRTARTALRRWVGDVADAPLGSKPAIDSIPLDTRALHTRLAHHPDIAVLASQEEIASTEAQLARANRKSDWSVEVMYSQRGAAFSDMVSVGVTIPWQWDRANRQDREVAAKLAMVDEAKARREEMLRVHVAEVQAMVAEWENGRERLARYDRELAPLATERTRAALAAYQGGKANLTDLLLARRNEIDVRMQAVQLEMETARLWAQLNFVIPEGSETTHASVPTRSTADPTKESQ
jgi:outer membrane protein TolC